MLKKVRKGDCFSANGRYASFKTNNVLLCHGIAVGQRDSPIDGKRFCHCWCERDDWVFDYSNGKNRIIPKVIYYLLGNIKEEDVVRYTNEQVLINSLKYGTWGPWDKKFESFE